jgi:hypothetical protein
MSLILSARYVHTPRITRRCDACGKRLGPHIYLYGRAHDTERPYAMRSCVTCCTHDRDLKIRAALAAAAMHADDVAAEATRLAAWNASLEMEKEAHA